MIRIENNQEVTTLLYEIKKMIMECIELRFVRTYKLIFFLQTNVSLNYVYYFTSYRTEISVRFN
jgi:hypothetical protein